MGQAILQFIPQIPSNQKKEFNQRKFNQNNLRILLISAFLTLEQAYYGLFISQAGTSLQKIYLSTALILFIFFLTSLYFYFNQPNSLSWFHVIYESSIGIFGLTSAIIRVALAHYKVFRLPTIYIAVIYGISVLFYYSHKQSFFIYFTSTLALILILPAYQPTLQSSTYIADTISNSLIAWIISIVNYRKYIKEFINTKTIEQKNKKLREKNKQINKINNQLQEISITDELTGIYNRRKLEEVLSKAQAEAERYKRQFSLILLDLDNFKAVNDKFGHPVGDEILIKISKLLAENIRDVDICGRWGGEEFLVICPATTRKSAVNLAERLRKLIENTTFPQVKTITSSFGVASYTKEDKIKNVIKKADESLYQAKAKGRNRVETKLTN